MKKTALVTGGGRGIGCQTVRRLCLDGYNTAFCYNSSEDSAKALSSELSSLGYNVFAVRCDISSGVSVKEMFEKIRKEFGEIDLLVNNAGIAQQKLFTDITDSDWDKLIGTDLSGVFYACREALPYMIRQKSGKIINVSSMWGQVGASCEVHYSAAKAGVIGLTKALAKETGPSGITVNCVCPGVVDTDMMSSFSKEDKDALTEEIPLGRIASADDIAHVISFLASDSADYITGQIIPVNGGFVI